MLRYINIIILFITITIIFCLVEDDSYFANSIKDLYFNFILNIM